LLLLAVASIQISFGQENSNLKWWNPAHSEFPVVSGQAWPDEVESISHRLPARAEKNVRKTVWNLSRQSAGLSLRFWTNADSIHVKYTLKGGISMPHMPATGASGLDLYSKSQHGKWLRCWGSYAINKESNYNFIINNDSNTYAKHGREYQLFLPLYNEIETLEIGTDNKFFFEPLPQRNEKPIVAYGTSICQGACASRPGMAWTNILERKLERPVINLGFSGNGRLEPALIDLLLEIDAKLYILDCLPNLNPDKDDTYKLALNAVKKIKKEKPNVPVILTAHVGYADDLTHEKNKTKYIRLNQELTRAFNQLISENHTNLFLVTKEDLGLGSDSFVDIIHPNDLGMTQYANAYEKVIRSVLNEGVGNSSTTIPKTQSRDIAVYKWENRHQKILELNKTNPPEICLFGDSIINFWGGEPRSSIANGKDSWEKMASLGVRNFGFGWDRIENVLWRVHHDELDGFKAKQIILMIGTNNLHLNSESEIIQGLQELIQAIKLRQPNKKLNVIGILPRIGKEQEVKEINLKIAQLANTEKVPYTDIGEGLLLKNGKLNETLFIDGLHPNPKGYRLLAQELKGVIGRH